MYSLEEMNLKMYDDYLKEEILIMKPYKFYKL